MTSLLAFIGQLSHYFENQLAAVTCLTLVIIPINIHLVRFFRTEHRGEPQLSSPDLARKSALHKWDAFVGRGRCWGAVFGRHRRLQTWGVETELTDLQMIGLEGVEAQAGSLEF